MRKLVIGQVETVLFPELGSVSTAARIDTGAMTSAIWASFAEEKDGQLSVIFFGKKTPLYTGQAVIFKEYSKAVVASSTGVAEERYKIHLLVEIGGRRIRARFTLSNRSKQAYPVLIGRNILRGKFVVDVSQS